MSAGVARSVKGRLPHNWRIAAQFDSVSATLELTSPDTDDFRITVDTTKTDQYGAGQHAIALAKLGAVSHVQAKYDDESGVLRFDSEHYLDFWIEVHVKSLQQDPSSDSGEPM